MPLLPNSSDSAMLPTPPGPEVPYLNFAGSFFTSSTTSRSEFQGESPFTTKTSGLMLVRATSVGSSHL